MHVNNNRSSISHLGICKEVDGVYIKYKILPAGGSRNKKACLKGTDSASTYFLSCTDYTVIVVDAHINMDEVSYKDMRV